MGNQCVEREIARERERAREKRKERKRERERARGRERENERGGLHKYFPVTSLENGLVYDD